jgi:predicted dehydrogenase
MTTERIRLGIVGVCGRGECYKDACDSRPDDVVISAVCDINVDDLPDAAERFGAKHQFSDYKTMLENECVDAVMIGTPMPLHAPQAIAALDRNIAVFSDVTAGVSIDECRELVLACERSSAVYMMGENYAYLRNNVAIREMVRQGLFGDVYYAEGEYLHELKELNEITKWRRHWQTGINGVTYPTHSLGPILQWFDGQRVTSVSCVGSGHHYRDARNEPYEHEDTCLMLCRMSGGGLVKIRADMLSDRPHNMAGYTLQGTRGCYESGRGFDASDKIWLRDRQPETDAAAALPDDESLEWERLDAIADEYLPDWYKAGSTLAEKAGHGGGDLYTVLDFIDTVHGRRPNPIGIHEAMDMTLPGLISQQSIQQDGQWLAVPDSRDWTEKA